MQAVYRTGALRRASVATLTAGLLAPRNRATLAAMELLDGEAEALTRTAIDLALSGDMAALRLCIERIIPVRREAVDMSFQQNNVKIDLRVLSLAERNEMERMLLQVMEQEVADSLA